MKTILDIISKQIIKSAHDCSKGGLAVAVSELCMTSQIGCNVSLDLVPGEKLSSDRILFSESHSRYLLTVEKKNISKLEKILKNNKVSFKMIGKFGGEKIHFTNNDTSVIDLRVDKVHKTWINSLRDLVLHG
jgi:phosphoribosylformylglycinamidine synthase